MRGGLTGLALDVAITEYRTASESAFGDGFEGERFMQLGFLHFPLQVFQGLVVGGQDNDVPLTSPVPGVT